MAPAANAQVHLLPVDYNPRKGFSLAITPESTFTDADVCRLDSVPQGTYNVLADGGGNFASYDSVTILDSGRTDVPSISLLATITVRGELLVES